MQKEKNGVPLERRKNGGVDRGKKPSRKKRGASWGKLGKKGSTRF